MSLRYVCLAVLLVVSLLGLTACPGGGQTNGDGNGGGGFDVGSITGDDEDGNDIVGNVGDTVNQAAGSDITGTGDGTNAGEGTEGEADATEVAWQDAPPAWTESVPSEPGMRLFATGSAPLPADETNTPAVFDAADADARAALETALTGLLADMLGDDLAGCLAPDCEGGASIAQAVTDSVATQCITAEPLVRQLVQAADETQTVHSLVAIGYDAIMPVLLSELETAVATFGGQVPPMPEADEDGNQPPHPLAVQLADLQQAQYGVQPFDPVGAGLPAE